MPSRFTPLNAATRIVSERQIHEKIKGTTAAVGPGENGLSQGNKTNAKIKKCAMAGGAVGRLITRRCKDDVRLSSAPQDKEAFLGVVSVKCRQSRIGQLAWAVGKELWAFSKQMDLRENEKSGIEWRASLVVRLD
jgi:hypothetical protein